MGQNTLSIYQRASAVSRIFVFNWEPDADTLSCDPISLVMLPFKMPLTGINKFFMDAEFLVPESRKRFQRHIRSVLNSKGKHLRAKGPAQTVLKIPLQDGNIVYYRLVFQVCERKDGTHFVPGSMQDVTSYYQKQEKLERSLQRDQMTGLYVREYVAKQVDRYLQSPESHGKSYAMIIVDIDHFKAVNDTFGHMIGDAVILNLSLSLRANFRHEDILGHIGGDEFLIFMPGADRNMAVEYCQKFRAAMRQTIGADDSKLVVTCSAGIAIGPVHGISYRSLFVHADSALYASKEHGRNRETIYDNSIALHRKAAVPQADGSSERDDAAVKVMNYKSFTEAPMEYIFHMVLHSQDTATTVQLLLETFAEHFHVDRAYIYWNSNGSYWPRVLYEYKKENVSEGFAAHNAEVRRVMWKHFRTQKDGRFTVCNDVTQTHHAQQFLNAKIYAYYECAIMERKQFIGGVGFDTCFGPHEWGNDERRVLGAFASIMQRFLLGQIYYEQQKKTGAVYLTN